MKKITLIFLIFTTFSFISIHKLYVSLTDINYNSKQKSVQIIMNVFMDDIELALNNEFKINSQISNPNEIKNINNYFFKYLKNHFKIKINNKVYTYKFIGKEYDGNIVYFYLEIENISSIKNIEIENTFLLKEYSNQQNLVKIKANNIRKSLFLTIDNYKGLLNYNK